MMRGRRKVELCSTGSGNPRTCYARQTDERRMPCPNCEGYRDPTVIVERELVGWTPGDKGTMKPIYTEGVRAKT